MAPRERNDSNPLRDHHVIPRCYLSGFEIPNDRPFIWAYKKGVGHNPPRQGFNPSKLSTRKRAGVIRDFYAHFSYGRDPDYDSVEKFLKAQEDATLHVLNKIRNFQLITNEEKSAFSSYIVHMILRSEFARNYVRETITTRIEDFQSNGLLEGIIACLLDAKEEKRGDLPTPQSLAMITANVLKSDPDSYKSVHVYMQQKPLNKLHKCLVEMTWVFFRASGGEHYITSDNPIYTPELKSENGGLAFPISSDICLMAFHSNDGPTRFQQVDASAVRDMNKITAGKCIEHFFSSENKSSLITDPDVLK